MYMDAVLFKAGHKPNVLYAYYTTILHAEFLTIIMPDVASF